VTAFAMGEYHPEVTIVAFSRDDLCDIADLVAAGQPLDGVHLQLHLRGSTLIFPTGVSEAQLRRLVDYASVLDWSGMERSN